MFRYLQNNFRIHFEVGGSISGKQTSITQDHGSRQLQEKALNHASSGTLIRLNLWRLRRLLFVVQSRYGKIGQVPADDPLCLLYVI